MKPKRIVVDADVGRATASGARVERGERPTPASVQVALTLDAMLKAQHRLTLPPELRAEWDRHVQPGTGGRKWLTRMFARRLVDRPTSDGDVDRVTALAHKLLSPPDARVATKHAHLIAAALAHTDRRVLSMDGKAREKYARLADDDREIGTVLWANPALATTRSWLERGARTDDAIAAGLGLSA